jgi:hypothetical protein
METSRRCANANAKSNANANAFVVIKKIMLLRAINLIPLLPNLIFSSAPVRLSLFSIANFVCLDFYVFLFRGIRAFSPNLPIIRNLSEPSLWPPLIIVILQQYSSFSVSFSSFLLSNFFRLFLHKKWAEI